MRAGLIAIISLTACARTGLSVDARVDASVDVTPGTPSTSNLKTVCDLRWGNDQGGAATAIVSDSKDDALALGFFVGTITIGDRTILSQSNDPQAGTALVMFDSSCKVKWLQSFFGTKPVGVAALPEDRFAVALVGDDGTIQPTEKLVAVDANGATIWNKDFVASGSGFEHSLVTSDHDGNVFLAGDVKTTTDFGAGPVGPAYLAKFDSSGALVFSNTLGGGALTAMVVDSNDRVWLAGAFVDDDAINFGDGHVLTPDTDSESYLVRVASANGAFIGDTHDWLVRALTVSSDASLTMVTSTSSIEHDDSNGAVLWTKPSESSLALTTDGAGNIWNGGGAPAHLYVSSFAPDGTAGYAQGWGDPTGNGVTALTVTPGGAVVFLASVASPSIDFGLGPLVSTHAESPPANDAVLVRLQ